MPWFYDRQHQNLLPPPPDILTIHLGMVKGVELSQEGLGDARTPLPFYSHCVVCAAAMQRAQNHQFGDKAQRDLG